MLFKAAKSLFNLVQWNIAKKLTYWIINKKQASCDMLHDTRLFKSAGVFIELVSKNIILSFVSSKFTYQRPSGMF